MDLMSSASSSSDASVGSSQLETCAMMPKPAFATVSSHSWSKPTPVALNASLALLWLLAVASMLVGTVTTPSSPSS